ncbi:MAG TPA: Ig-like domain-containing protein, partial [Pyrinomonadaceae bacterium]
ITTRSARLEAPPAVPLPAAPTNLSAAQVNQGLGTVTADVTLTWADNSSDEQGFKVERRTATGAYSQVALLPANTTTASFFAGSNDDAFFRVRAYNAAGDTAYTNEAGAPRHGYATITPNTYNEPANVRLSSTASDPDGITRVEFHYATDATYPNFALLATDTTAPYEYDWQNVAGGNYYTVAKAFDGQGSSTTVLNNNFAVFRNPSATITSPANNATFAAGSTVTLTATAQTTNSRSDEYLTRVDFYANTTLVGTVQGSLPTYTFNWTNVPAGTYSLTARPTSSFNLTGASPAVNVTVGSPGVNISGRVTNGSGPLYGVKLALSGNQSATATTNANGDFVFTNVAAGGGYTVTPAAGGYTFSPSALTLNNVTASQTANFAGTPGPAVTVDPNAVPIYTQPADGRAVEGPSSKLVTGEQHDAEVADDFDMAAEIKRVRVRGTRGGYNLPPNPTYLGVYVRFYDGANGAPGALQAEHYLPKGAPGVSFDAAQPTTYDITLPTPFAATGRHFVSVQPVYGGSWEAWHVTSGNYPMVRGSVWYKRDRLNGGAWATPASPYQAYDLSFDLFGTLQSSPRLAGFTPASAQRSGLVRINGEFFGTSQQTGALTIDGKPSPFIPYWSDTLIIAHVPETSALGPVTVSVTGPAGTVTGTLNVTTRQSDGRIRWRMEAAGDYILGRPAVAPPGAAGAGTIYAATNAGYLYAWAPDGALKWVAPGASGDDPVSVGADGTIYTASAERNAQGQVGPAINAFNPDGTRKWTFIDLASQSVRAGPSVGPDGKIYFVMRPLVDAQQRPTGVNLAALRPDGTLAWSVNRDFHRYGDLGKELTFGRTLPHVYFAFDVNDDPDPSFVNGGTFAYNFDGQLVWQQPGMCCGVPAVPPDEGVRHFDTRLDPLTGNVVYNFTNEPTEGAPDAGPDNTHYIKVRSR